MNANAEPWTSAGCHCCAKSAIRNSKSLHFTPRCLVSILFLTGKKGESVHNFGNCFEFDLHLDAKDATCSHNQLVTSARENNIFMYLCVPENASCPPAGPAFCIVLPSVLFWPYVHYKPFFRIRKGTRQHALNISFYSNCKNAYNNEMWHNPFLPDVHQFLFICFFVNVIKPLSYV